MKKQKNEERENELAKICEPFYEEDIKKIDKKKQEAKSKANPSCNRCYGRGYLEGQNCIGQSFIKLCDKSRCAATKYLSKNKKFTYKVTKGLGENAEVIEVF